jgi:DNA uptake protein ComE-like DNA-binding protein
MRHDPRTTILVSLLVLLLFGLSACTSGSRAQNQAAQDEQTREKVANATEKAKEESEKAAQQVRVAAQQAEHQAKVAADGVKEGWNRDQPSTLDLNSATETELQRLPGLSESKVRQVINGRPYRNTEELVTRGILSQTEYDRIQDRLSVQ